MPNPIKVAASDGRPGMDWVPIDVSGGDVDLTDPSGPTGGWCARQLFVTGTGDVVFLGVGAPNLDPASRTVTVPDNFYLQGIVQKVYQTGTDATGIFALV